MFTTSMVLAFSMGAAMLAAGTDAGIQIRGFACSRDVCSEDEPIHFAIDGIEYPASCDVQWDFGDGSHARGIPGTEHEYFEPGTYLVSARAATNDRELRFEKMIVVAPWPTGISFPNPYIQLTPHATEVPFGTSLVLHVTVLSPFPQYCRCRLISTNEKTIQVIDQIPRDAPVGSVWPIRIVASSPGDAFVLVDTSFVRAGGFYVGVFRVAEPLTRRGRALRRS